MGLGAVEMDASAEAWCRPGLVALLATGAAWRLGRWALGMPLWGDEAMLGINIWERSFSGLRLPLDSVQVAPLGFLWLEKAVMLALGPGERVVRLVPTIASLAAIVLFAFLAVRHLPPTPAVMATGFLAASYYATRHGAELKPYAFDLLAATIVLALTLEWLRKPDALVPGLALTVTAPLLLALSYPAIFALGGASLVVSNRMARDRRQASLLVALALAASTLTAFAALYAATGRGQYSSTIGDMQRHWTTAFPPFNPFRAAWWLLDVHTGNLMAYPVGGKNFGSTFTFLAFLTGAVSLWRTGRRELLSLLLLPFGLTLLAAALHLYPYGTSARVAQHLAPAICLLAGWGLAAMLARIRPAAPSRRSTFLAAIAAFIAIALAGLSRDVVQPYKTRGDLQVRAIVDEAFRRDPRRTIVTVGLPPPLASFRWYLATSPGRVVHAAGWSDLPPLDQSGSLSVLTFDPDPGLPEAIEAALQDRGFQAVRRSDVEHHLSLSLGEVRISYCRSMWWTFPVSHYP